jgi:hypothetical protein
MDSYCYLAKAKLGHFGLMEINVLYPGLLLNEVAYKLMMIDVISKVL